MYFKQKTVSKKSDGLVRCARYAFMPNRLAYCGPTDKNEDLLYLTTEEKNKKGLNHILENFETLHPYLSLIARGNRINSPFHPQVVEAYWLGNNLLENVTLNNFYVHLMEGLNLRKKLSLSSKNYLEEKLPQGALPNHAFHVLNIFIRTGKEFVAHTLETMEACRISWGKIKKIQKDNFLVAYQPLIYLDKKLLLGSNLEKKVKREIEGKTFILNPKVGDIIAFHWNLACEILNPYQVKDLYFYTQKAITLANKTI